MKATYTFCIIFLLSIQFSHSQVFEVGDHINDLIGNICGNGSGVWKFSLNENKKVLFISSFATWWKPCQSEAQTIEEIYKQFKDKDVEVIGAGIDWNQPYSCKEWAKKFRLTFPILDDSKGSQIYNYFGNGIVPYNVVIDRSGRLIYSESGFKKKEIVNVIELALKTPKINKVNIKKKNLKAHYKTRYEKLKENKGSEFWN